MNILTDPNWWSRFKGYMSGNDSRLTPGGEANPFTTGSSPGGKPISAESALKLSAVWSCVRLRSQTIGSLPLHLRDSDKKIADQHPLYKILHEAPNADMTASEYWEATVASLDLWGNAYSLITRNVVGNVVALEVLNPEYMAVARSKSGEITYKYGEGYSKIKYSEDQILHIKGFTLDGLVGLSPIKYQMQAIGMQSEANDAAQQEFKNNLKIGGFLETGERVLSDDQRNRMRENLATFGKVENAGKWMVLEAGMKPASAGDIRINPQEAQLLESRYFGIEEICRAFNVPPQLIFQTDKASSWASSLEQMNLGFLTYSLTPVLVRIEQAITRKLLSPADRAKYKPKYSVEGILRADSAGRASFYSTMVNNGLMTRNEVRGLENLPAHAGADQLTVQLALTTIDQLGKPTL